VQVVARVVTVQGAGISRAVPLAQVKQWRRDDGSLVLGLGDAEILLADGHAWESEVGFGGDDASHATTVAPAAAPGTGPAEHGPTAYPASVAANRGSWLPLAAMALAVLAVVAALYAYAIPTASHWLIGAVPLSVDRAIGDLSFASMDGTMLRPSALPAPTREALRAAFDRAVRAADGAAAAAAAPIAIEFRQGNIGPNAFALPGGRIVVTDELVSLVDAREDVVVGVLGHEYGHAKSRHGVRMVAQSALLQTVADALIGNFSGLLAGAPQVLGEQAYSRDFEREADSESVRVMRAGGYSPRAMVVFFEKLAAMKLTTGAGLAIAFASHPADTERVAYFEQATGGR
jgi:Zn-dependent protease with chaperone function